MPMHQKANTTSVLKFQPGSTWNPYKPLSNNTENLTCQTSALRLISVLPNDTIGFFTVIDNLELSKNNERILDLLEFSRYCNSHSAYSHVTRGFTNLTYSHVTRGFTNDCNCFQATATESKSIGNIGQRRPQTNKVLFRTEVVWLWYLHWRKEDEYMGLLHCSNWFT
ncbi:hypothetical protein DPMN_064276 [Dreissena polymorpha]|uniref:Uncharacterized protein n=1 Tax=Dreissena polymorpha TaxID=45954 RepID=A0A9D4HL06_DREPO|nr:hypothetical protein DPMN_064276 [Dreissena polymorpha]